MAKMGFLGWLTYALITIGAIAWGVYGVTGFFMDAPFLLVDAITFGVGWLTNLIYTLVGVFGVIALIIIPWLAKK